MHSTNHARVLGLGLLLALAAGCGDDKRSGLVVETSVAKRTVVAGERIGARCAVLDPLGRPALDEQGEPLTDNVEFAITYQHESSFSADGEGEVIAVRAGTGSVRCASPELGLVDEHPENILIVAGPAVRVVTRLAKGTSVAGEAVGVSCLAFDAFNNAVTELDQSLALSPLVAGVTMTANAITASFAGEYEVSCVVSSVADVEEDILVVVPGLPSTLVVAVDPERSLYAINDQVSLVAAAHDRFGNRVDDVAFSYAASPGVTSPSEARFQFTKDGTVTLSATVTSPTHDNAVLTAPLEIPVNSAGPVIECRRADAPALPSEAYMLQSGPGTLVVPVRVTDAFQVQAVTINGVPATLDVASATYRAGVAVGFGMNFFDVVAKDQFGKENSTTCFALVAQNFTAEDTQMPGALGMRLDPNAIGDPQPTGLNSLNDIFHTVLSSDRLRALVNDRLVATNPISDGNCGFIACTPKVDYNGGTIQWNPPSSSLSLVPGGLKVQVTLPNLRLSGSACSTPCCIGGTTIRVRVTSVSATVSFGLELQGGVLHAAVQGSPDVTVGSVSLDASGFCGLIVEVLESFFANKVRAAIGDALGGFIDSDVGPLLDQLVSSLDINTLGRSFAVPRLDGTGNIELRFGLGFSSFNITTARALLGISTRFTPAAIAHIRPSLGVARRTPNPLLDPPGTNSTRPVGLSLYEGVLNQVLHGLWRGGFFQASLQIGGGTATIDARLPPVAAITGNQVQLMLGGIQTTIRIPGIIDAPISILFGGRANASVSLVGDELRFGNLTLTQLFVSFGVSLTQNQRNAMANLLTQVLQKALADAINDGLPAFPIPTFALPPSAGEFGLPAGALLGILGPQLSISGSHFVPTGAFGVRN